VIPVTWRGAALSDTPSSAVRPPNRTVTPLMSSTPDLAGPTTPASDEPAFIEPTLV
jgi:hypothetical protein